MMHLTSHTQVMVYEGPGAERDLVQQTLASLEKSLDEHQIQIKTFTNPALLDQREVSHLVFPGGNAFRFSSLKDNTHKIKSLLATKHFLGICAGAILASQKFYINFPNSENNVLTAYEPIGGFPKIRCTSIAPIIRRSENPVLNATAMKVHWTMVTGESLELKLFHNLGPCFTSLRADCTSIGKYIDYHQSIKTNDPFPETFDLDQPSCALLYENPVTDARSILVGIHAELNLEQMKLDNLNEEESAHFEAVLNELKGENEKRQIVWKDILTRLDMPLKL